MIIYTGKPFPYLINFLLTFGTYAMVCPLRFGKNLRWRLPTFIKRPPNIERAVLWILLYCHYIPILSFLKTVLRFYKDYLI